MKLIKSLKKGFTKKAQSNLSLAIYSVLIAILAWFVISMTFYPSVPKTIKDVELTVDLNGTSAAENGLSVIDCNIKKVNVRIKGSRTQIGKLDSGSLIAYVDVENVRSSGIKTLNIKVKSENGVPFELESVYPETAVVEFDKFETKKFEVKPYIPKIKYAEGKTVNESELTCEPNEINITGPSAELEKIAECRAVSNKSLLLDSSYNLTSDEVQLLAEDGTILYPSSFLKMSPSNFTLYIPVLTQKTVDLTVSLVNAPQDFDKEWFISKLKFSNNSLTIASKNSQSEIPDILDVGKIVLSDVDIDREFSTSFPITDMLNEKNLINVSELDQITVSLDSTDLVKREFTITNINLQNEPEKSKYDYEVFTPSLKINVIGPADVVSELTASDFVAEANLLNTSIMSDQFTYDVTISCLTSNRVWALNRSKIKIQRTEHVKPTTKSNIDDLNP